MKNILLFTAFVCLLFGCSKESLGTVSADLKQEIKLKEGQTALYKQDAAQVVRLKIEHVSDSRCPSDVTCVTFGKVEVRLRLGAVETSGESITMCLGDCSRGSQGVDEAVVTVGAIPYKIKLLGVTPLPKHDEQKSVVKEVQLVLERL